MNYNAETQRYFEHTPAAGSLEGADVFSGSAGGRDQGVCVRFDLRVRDGNILEARFLAFGCPHAIAASSWVAEHAGEADASGAMPVTVERLSGIFAVPIEKRGRLLVVEDAWAAAVAAYRAAR